MSVTLEEIWSLFKETDRLIKEQAQENRTGFLELRDLISKHAEEARIRSEETEGEFQEVNRRFQETDRKFQETDRKFQETTLKFQETDRKFQETTLKFQETDRKFQETDRKFQETDRKFQETERLLKQQSQDTDRRMAKLSEEVNQKIGRLGGRLGDFVEELIKPAVVRLFQERGIEVHAVSRNVEANNPTLKLAMQIDLLVTNTDTCVLIEVKSNLSIDDVNEHVERMSKFKRLFQAYAGNKVYGAVAGMVVPENVAKYAYRKGFFVIAHKGDSVKFLNDDKFRPMVW